MSEDTAAFPIDELVQRVADALDRAGVEQTNGQVSAAPTERTLRYYRTRGLLDPPAGHRGRTALYARRHVLQVLAIKRLQAGDVPLHEIHQRLVGRSDADLAGIAGIDPSAIGHPPAMARRRGFWADRPVATTAVTTDPSRARIAGMQFNAGVRLTFPSSRDLTEADHSALAAAMGGVLVCLHERHLVPDQLDVAERTTP